MTYKIKNPIFRDDEKNNTIYKRSNKFIGWGTLKVNDIKYIDNTGCGKSKKTSCIWYMKLKTIIILLR